MSLIILKTHEMSNEAVCKFFYLLKYVVNPLKKQEMCNDMVQNGPYLFESVLASHKNQKICEDAVEKKKQTSWNLPPAASWSKKFGNTP